MLLHAWRLELDLEFLRGGPGRSFKAARRWAEARAARGGGACCDAEGRLRPLVVEAPEPFADALA